MPEQQSIRKKLFLAACNLLARKPYTVAELKKKLIQKYPNSTRPSEASAKRLMPLRSRGFGGATLELLEETISRLKELHYLDDEQYAQSFVRSKIARKPQGLKLLEFNMTKKGFSKETARNAISEESIDEFKLAEAAIAKKVKFLRNLPVRPSEGSAKGLRPRSSGEPGVGATKQKQKLYRFLLSRGFTSGTAYKVLNSLYKQDTT